MIIQAVDMTGIWISFSSYAFMDFSGGDIRMLQELEGLNVIGWFAPDDGAALLSLLGSATFKVLLSNQELGLVYSKNHVNSCKNWIMLHLGS